jgi:hypothetical protein
MPMTFIPPVECGWVQRCHDVVNKTITKKISDGPSGNTHTINTDYNINVAGIVIPIVKTNRIFTVSYSTTYGVPADARGYVGSDPIFCTETAPNQPVCTVSENCVIESSTLKYLDQRYGVCLYRYQKDDILMSKTSAELAEIKVESGSIYPHQVQIKTSNYVANRLVEWRLIKDGVQTILKTSTEAIHPFGPRNNGQASGVGLFPDYVPDPETRVVLLFPQPPSLGIPWSDVICRLGFYDYGHEAGAESQLNKDDGGEKDMFYPFWCRELQTDPFWKSAAFNRYNISWFNMGLTVDSSYRPIDVLTDPLPCGSYVNHAQQGELYQFLFDGSTVETSKDLTTEINEALADGLITSGTTLYYPIGVV